MGLEKVQYVPLTTKPKLSHPSEKEQRVFDRTIDFEHKELKLSNFETIQYSTIELYDKNNDGIFSDGEHLRIKTVKGDVILLHNFKNKEDIEATKNHYYTEYNAFYNGSTNPIYTPFSFDFLYFTQRTYKPKEIHDTEISRLFPLSKRLNVPKEIRQNEHINNFILGLNNYRKKVEKLTGLTNQEYIKLAQLALAIAQEEMNANTLEQHSKNKFTHGISNIKIENDAKKLQEQYQQLGITINCPSNISKDDQLAAAATIIKLNYIRTHDYPIYLETCKNNKIPPERILSDTEYLAARWKSILVIDKRQDGLDTTKAKANIDMILDFRKNPNITPPKGGRVREILYWFNKFQNGNNNASFI